MSGMDLTPDCCITGPTFLDLLATVPQLLVSCLDVWWTHGEGIRVLRLASTEANRIASRAITKFSLELGGDISLVVPAVIPLLRDLPLQQLHVTVITKSGEHSCQCPICFSVRFPSVPLYLQSNRTLKQIRGDPSPTQVIAVLDRLPTVLSTELLKIIKPGPLVLIS